MKINMNGQSRITLAAGIAILLSSGLSAVRSAPSQRGHQSPSNSSSAASPDTSKDPEVQRYMQYVQRSLRSVWTPPKYVGTTITRDVHVRFHVLKDGSIANVKLDNNKSTSDPYSKAALDALHKASPLEAPTERVLRLGNDGKPFLDIAFSFAYNQGSPARTATVPSGHGRIASAAVAFTDGLSALTKLDGRGISTDSGVLVPTKRTDGVVPYTVATHATIQVYQHASGAAALQLASKWNVSQEANRQNATWRNWSIGIQSELDKAVRQQYGPVSCSTWAGVIIEPNGTFEQLSAGKDVLPTSGRNGRFISDNRLYELLLRIVKKTAHPNVPVWDQLSAPDHLRVIISGFIVNGYEYGQPQYRSIIPKLLPQSGSAPQRERAHQVPAAVPWGTKERRPAGNKTPFASGSIPNLDEGAEAFYQGRYREAIPHLLAKAGQQPDDINTIRQLAQCYQKLGNNADAVRWYERAMQFYDRGYTPQVLSDYPNLRVDLRQYVAILRQLNDSQHADQIQQTWDARFSR